MGLDRLRVFLAWTTVIVWLASLALDAIVPTYDVPATVHALMLIVAGALFGPTITRKRNDDG